MLNKTTTKKDKTAAVIYLAAVMAAAFGLTFSFRYLLKLSFIGQIRIGGFNVGLTLVQIFIYGLIVAACFAALAVERWQKRGEDLNDSFESGQERFSYFSAIGFEKGGYIKRILAGLVLAAALLIAVFIPGLFKTYLFDVRNFTAAEIAYNFFVYMLLVGLGEEILFRGYFFNKLGCIFANKHIIIIISSLLFGLWHIINGSWIQVLFTSVIGTALGYLRMMKGAGLLSCIVAHGFFNTMLMVLGLILFNFAI